MQTETLTAEVSRIRAKTIVDSVRSRRAAASCWVLALALGMFAMPATLVADSSFAVVEAQIVDPVYGALTGRACDALGAILPDVVVTLTGPSLMTPRITTTASDGHYLLPALPPGDYVVTFARAGFRAVKASAHVAAGSTASLDTTLQIEGVVVSTTVEPRASVLDRHGTAITQTFTRQQLAALPGSRSMFAILSSTPGVQVSRFEVGGNTGDAGGFFGAYGTQGGSRPTVESMSVVQIFPFGFTLDYGAFEEASVVLAAQGPEWAVPGVHVQFIGRSGGNQYHGGFFGGLERRDWQSHNIDAGQEQRALDADTPLSPDANALSRFYDVNADLGGYIVRDHAWWYSSFRDQDIQLRQVNFPVKPSRTHLRNYTGKATVRTGAQNIVAFAQAARNHQPNRLDPFGPDAGAGLNVATAIHQSEDATSSLHVSGIVWKAEWNGTLGNRIFAEARAGQFNVLRSLTPNGGAPRFEDIDTLVVAGGGRHSQRRLRRNEVQGSASYFGNGGAGSHYVKMGAQLVNSVTEDRILASFPGNVLQVTGNGQPVEVYRFLAPSAAASGLRSLAVYASDRWRISDRITLNLGVRFDRYRVFLPAQPAPAGAEDQPAVFPAVDDVVVWNRAAPRVSAAIDPFLSGKTIVKFSYGRFWLAPGDLGPAATANTAEWWRRYAWQDANGNGLWDPGEEGALRDSRGGEATQIVDPNLRAPWIDEATAFVEQELRAAIGIRTGMVWRRDGGEYARQNLARPFTAFTNPVIIPDPGPDGRVGTADDRPGLPGYNLSPDAAATAPVNVIRNVESTDSRYLTWEIGAQRRMQRWSLSAGFTHTWSLEHANDYGDQVVRQNEFAVNPNDFINTVSGGRHRFTTWTATAWGTFRAPWELAITPMVRHQSGQPFGRTVTASMNYGVIKVLAEPIGTRRTDNVTLVDLRVERDLWRSAARHVSIFLDVFNLLNANPEQDVNWASGPGFLAPLAVVAPRIARVGVRAGF